MPLGEGTLLQRNVTDPYANLQLQRTTLGYNEVDNNLHFRLQLGSS